MSKRGRVLGIFLRQLFNVAKWVVDGLEVGQKLDFVTEFIRLLPLGSFLHFALTAPLDVNGVTTTVHDFRSPGFYIDEFPIAAQPCGS